MVYELIIFIYCIIVFFISYIFLNFYEIYNKYKSDMFPFIARNNKFLMSASAFLTTVFILFFIFDFFYNVNISKAYEVLNFNTEILNIKEKILKRPFFLFFYFSFVSFFFLLIDTICVMCLDYVNELIRDYLPNNSLFIYYYFFIFIIFFIIFIMDLYIKFII